MKQHRTAVLLLLGTALSLTPAGALGRSEGAIQKTWDYPEDIRALVIDCDRQDVVLKAGGPRLTGRLVGDTGDVVKASRSGDTVTIQVKTDRSWFSWRKKTARIELTVPPGLELDLTTASGAILVQVSAARLTARSASGDIEAPRGGGSADVDSASGTVRLAGFSGPVKASALSGDLHLEDLSGDIQASSMSGDLNGRNLQPSDRSRFSSVSGDVDLQLQGGASAYEARLESVSGDLNLGDQEAERELRGGNGPVIVVKSVNGDVRVR